MARTTRTYDQHGRLIRVRTYRRTYIGPGSRDALGSLAKSMSIVLVVIFVIAWPLIVNIGGWRYVLWGAWLALLALVLIAVVVPRRGARRRDRTPRTSPRSVPQSTGSPAPVSSRVPAPPNAPVPPQGTASRPRLVENPSKPVVRTKPLQVCVEVDRRHELLQALHSRMLLLLHEREYEHDRTVSASFDPFDLIKKVTELRDAGLITKEQFEGKRDEILGRI